MTKVRNPLTLFERMYYDDFNNNYDTETFDYSGKFVKIIVENKSNPFTFDKVVDAIIDSKPLELKIVENFQEFLGENVSTSLEDVENTQELMEDYIDSVNTDIDKGKLKILMNGLYNEAVDMEIQ